MAKTVDVKSLISNDRLKRPSNISPRQNAEPENSSATAPNNSLDTKKDEKLREEAKARALDAAALALESEAASFRREAKKLRDASKSKKARERHRNIWREVCAMIEKGCSDNEAREHIAARHKIPRETVDYWIDWADKQQAAFGKWRRDREIFRLAHTFSNAELAERFRLHKNQISRILHRQLDAARRNGTVQ